MKWRIKNKYIKKFLLPIAVLLLAAIVCILTPLNRPLFSDDSSLVVLDRNGHIIRVFLDQHQQWFIPTPPRMNVPEKIKKAIILAEDRYFYSHPGVNLFSVARAIYQNIKEGRIVSGASTVTMQLARIMHPKKRTLPNKIVETLQALKIELLYSKDEILKLYLDHAPFGGNVVGYRAASLRYWGKDASDLTWSEAAILASLPNSPSLMVPGKDMKRLRRRRNFLLKKLYKAGLISGSDLHSALREPLPQGVRPFPVVAPQFALLVKARGAKGLVKTTIDLNLQRLVMSILRRHVQYLRTIGINNAAVLLVNTQNGEVMAYAGSAFFSDHEHQGEVDGVQAPRSTGSILKPFLYALSMDSGIILPESVMLDIPSFYGAFSPSNADEKFSGLVTVKEALIQSLNVPAVRLLNEFGLHSFYTFLKHAGMTTLYRSADNYGLPLIIGGAEANLWDITSMYRGLGLEGVFSNLKIFPNSRTFSGKRLISRGACWLVLNIVRDLKRPGSEYYWQFFQGQRPLAWKTGTSYGRRDGWAVGVSPMWTIGVWTGNFKGQGNTMLSGASSAGPILFDIFNSLPWGDLPQWFRKPVTDLKKVRICSDTGYVAGPNCKKTLITEAPMKAQNIKICPYHKIVTVSDDGKYSVCSLCWIPGHYKRISALVYPPEVVQLLRLRGQAVDPIPPHNPNCPALAQGNPLQLVYPKNGSKIFLPRDFGEKLQRITCRAANRFGGRTIFWYLDNRYLGKTKGKHTLAITVSSGSHTLVVVDDQGNHARCKFKVFRRSQ